MKVNFSEVLFTDESRITLDGVDGLAKGEILSNSDVLVVKGKQPKSSSVIIWAGIVDQTIIGPFKVDKS